MHIRHRSPTPPPTARVPHPTPPAAAMPSIDEVMQPRSLSPKRVSFGALPEAPHPVANDTQPSSAMVRLLAFFHPVRTAAQLMLGELELRHGISGDVGEKYIADVEASLANLGIDAALRQVLGKFEGEADLAKVATFFEDTSHEAIAEKLSILAPMLKQLAEMPASQAPEVKHKESKTCEALLAVLVPNMPSDAPKDLMVRAVKDELSHGERKEALAWVSDPSYPVAARIEAALDKKLSKLCLRHEVMDKALKLLAPKQIAVCDEILATSPEDIATRRLRAQMRTIAGDAQGAIADYEVILKEDIDGDAYFARGLLRLSAGDHAGGLVDLERALSLNLGSSEVYAAYLHAYVEHGTGIARRGLCALALGEVAIANQAHAEASKQMPDDKDTVRLGEALKQHDALSLPEPVTLALLKPTKVADTNAEKVADGIVKCLPWEDAIVARTVVTLDHDFGFGASADENTVRQGLKATHKAGKHAVRAFFAEMCSPEQLGQFDALLKSPAGAILQRAILPWVDTLQMQHDVWADGLRSDEPLPIEPMLTAPQATLRSMFEALVPVNALTGGLYGAKADAMAAAFVRRLDPKDLPTVMALLDDDTVLLFIRAYKAALEMTFASVSALELVKIAQSLAPRELKLTKAALKKDPKDVAALRARAIAHGLLEQQGESMQAFDDLVKAAPTARNHVQRAMQLHVCGQQDRALDDANEALKRAPFNADAHSVRASIYLARDAREDAMRDTTRAMGLAITNAQKQAAAALQEAVMEGFDMDSEADSDSDDEGGSAEPAGERERNAGHTDARR